MLTGFQTVATYVPTRRDCEVVSRRQDGRVVTDVLTVQCPAAGAAADRTATVAAQA
jgi:hypothetical protein